jgi:archaellum component FlaC
MRASPSQELRETCRALFRHSAGHGIGRNLTGIALVVTFVLLGVVLVGPVQEALRVSQAPGAGSQSDLLSQAIGQMGAKFFVSAMGLVGSFAFQGFASFLERRLLAQLDSMRARFELTTQTLDAHKIVLASARKDALGVLKAELTQTRKELSERLEHLESVEVSIQDIGSEVKTHFGTMMKEQVGDVITRQLTAVERAVRDIASELQRTIATGFATTLQTEMTTVREHLNAIQKALSEKQEHDLGRILEQLRDTVSGGFHSQSQDMARQMADLVGVLPRLESQFEVMSKALGENARQWGTENQRAIDVLTDKVTVLLGSFDKVRNDLETATARVLRASTESSHRLSEENQQVLGQLGSTVSSVMGGFKNVLAGMNDSTQRLVDAAALSAQNLQDHTVRQAGTLQGQVDALRDAANSGMHNVVARSEEFSKVMGKTQDGLRELTEQLRNTAAQLVSATRSAGDTHDKAKNASTQMEDVANQLRETAKTFQGLSQARQVAVNEEKSLLGVQREALDRVTPVLTGLAQTYEDAVSRQSQVLSSQWTKVVREMESVVDRTSGELLQGVEELNDTVRELKEILRPQGKRT